MRSPVLICILIEHVLPNSVRISCALACMAAAAGGLDDLGCYVRGRGYTLLLGEKVPCHPGTFLSSAATTLTLTHFRYCFCNKLSQTVQPLFRCFFMQQNTVNKMKGWPPSNAYISSFHISTEPEEDFSFTCDVLSYLGNLPHFSFCRANWVLWGPI